MLCRVTRRIEHVARIRDKYSACSLANGWQQFVLKEQGGVFPSISADEENSVTLESDVEMPHGLLRTEQRLADYLFSAANAAFDPVRASTVYQDMTAPLAHYWIATAHMSGLATLSVMDEDATLEAIERTLQGGARCIELDVWDSSTDDGQVISDSQVVYTIK